jgi:hypothetical protein
MLGTPSCTSASNRAKQRAADLAAVGKQHWGAADFDAFLEVVPDAGLWTLLVSLGVEPSDSSMPQQLDRAATILRIKREAIWSSSNILSYPFKEKTEFRYDEAVRWVADEFDVAPAITTASTTFEVEQAVAVTTFVNVWDKLTPSQREEVLAQLDPDRRIQDHAAVAVMAGTGAAAALSAAALLNGFAFYTTMTTVMSVVAGWFGLTLPWMAYQGATTAVAFLATNPIGWGIIGVGALTSIAWLGGANERKTAAFILQVNALRAAAWQDAGRKFPS